MDATDLWSRALMLDEHKAFDHRDAANLSGGGGSGRPFVDAIIVPAGRPADNLSEAASLAASTGAFLLVICSHDADPHEAAEVMARAGHAAGMAVDLVDDWGHLLLSMYTDRIPDALWGWPRWNSPLKRNIGLLIAALVGWNRVLFLDDDIRGLDAARVRRVGSLLDRYSAVGVRANAFPDNSVVRHAVRLAGFDQDVFLSGGALAVNTAAMRSFFPAIYNEEWFYLLPGLGRGPMATVGTVPQLEYDPFVPERAAREEFGDLLGEGMLEWLLIRGTLDPPPVYWAHARVARQKLLFDVRTCLAEHPSNHGFARATAAVQAASERLQTISPAACVNWIASWRADLSLWQRRLTRLPRVPTPRDAADWLGLPTV